MNEYCLGNYQRGKELLEERLLSPKKIGWKRKITNLHLILVLVNEALVNQENALEHAKELFSVRSVEV